MKIIFMGAGECLGRCFKIYDNLFLEDNIVEIWDNNLLVKEINFHQKKFIIKKPHTIPKDVFVLITTDRYEEEIRNQLMFDIGISKQQIYNWRYLFNKLKWEIIKSYKTTKDVELQEIIGYLENHDLDVFPNGLSEKYRDCADDIKVFCDDLTGLSYVFWNGRKLFMQRGKGITWIKDYVNSLKEEQDQHSPHCYSQFSKGIKGDCVLVDAGAAEGFFALDYIDDVRKVYLIEHDPLWIEALQHTYAPYGDKVEIIDRWLGNSIDNIHVTLDSLDTLEYPISFIKLDIEGNEVSALNGAAKMLSENRALEIISCTYHCSHDADILSEKLLAAHFNVCYSHGYMFFPEENSIIGELRHGLLYAKKTERKRIVLWGVGDLFENVYKAININQCEIVAVVDMRWKSLNAKHGIDIQSPESLKTMEFDNLLITTKKFQACYRCAKELGIEYEKIIAFWGSELTNYSFVNWFAWKYALAIEKEKIMQNRLLNAPYEFGNSDYPQIRSSEELLLYLIRYKKSLCRFGDGEFDIMLRRNAPWFQRQSKELSERLCNIIQSIDDSVCLAIADNFGYLGRYTESAADEIRSYIVKGTTRKDIYKLLHQNIIYFDAYVSRPYMIYKDKEKSNRIFDLWKKIWRNRNVLIVEGRNSCIGMRNDLFASTSSIRRVICPGKDSYTVYNKIFKSVSNIVESDDLVLISLGPTATVLAYDLARLGIQAIDMGQLDNEYDWYCDGAVDRINIPGKIVAELFNGREFQRVHDCNYESQIVTIIDGE